MLSLHQLVSDLQLTCSHMEQLVVSSIRRNSNCHVLCFNWNWKWALGAATLDDFGLYGGTVQNLAITTEGKFYTSAPTVTISHPGTSFVSAQLILVEVLMVHLLIQVQLPSQRQEDHIQLPTVVINTSGSMVPPTVRCWYCYDSPNHRYCYF